MGGGVGGLVEVDHAVLEIFFQGSVEGGGAHGDRCVMRSSDIQLIIVLNGGSTFNRRGQSSVL